MMGLADPKLLDEFEQAEIDDPTDPTPRKEVDGRTIYLISALNRKDFSLLTTVSLANLASLS